MFQTDDERIEERTQRLSDIDDLKQMRTALEEAQGRMQARAKVASSKVTSDALHATCNGIDNLFHDEIDAAIGALENQLSDLGDPDEEAEQRSLIGYALWMRGAVA